MTDNHDPHVGALVYCASVTLREVLPMTRTKIAFLVAAVFAFYSRRRRRMQRPST